MPLNVHVKELTVIGWNVESGGADPQWISRVIANQQDCAIWGLTEVEGSSWAKMFENAAEVGEYADYKYILGTTCEHDRLLIVYNEELLERVKSYELHRINLLERVRAPLVAYFRIRGTNREFLFMLNHLYRGSRKLRQQQARMLNKWARKQRLPIVAVGDYNFDWDVRYGEQLHGRGFDYLTANQVFKWVRPKRLVRTHCDRAYNTVVDFIFVGGKAKKWKGYSEILIPQRLYCPDGTQRSDHRPVLAKFWIPTRKLKDG